MDKLRIPDVDVVLLGVSTLPFFVVSAPVVTLMDARVEGIILGAIALAGLVAIASKAIFGWQHVVARFVLAVSGLWGVIGNGHQEYAVIIPGGMGTLAQWLWIAGVIVLVYARSLCVEAHYLESTKSEKVQSRL
jgi:uncharacterized membrane protein